jgi:hypothetical protein
VLDVARFKYPSHWTDLMTLYQSMKTLDEQSGLNRGFIIACRSTELFADICRFTPDYPLIKENTEYFESGDHKEKFTAICEHKSEDKVFAFLNIVKHSPPKLMDLLTLLVIQFTYALETKRGNIGEDLHKLLDQIGSIHPGFEHADFTSHDFDKFPLLSVLRDYLPGKHKKLLALIYQLFENQLYERKTSPDLAKAILFWQNQLFI